MRRLHPTIVIFLAVLFAVQMAAATGLDCLQSPRQAAQHSCPCCETVQGHQAAQDCGMCGVPEQPTRAPVAIVVQAPTMVAALAPSAQPVMPTVAERLRVDEVAPAPAPPSLRDAGVRAPPCLW